MATHSSSLAWKIPWMEEPGRLQSMKITKSRTGQSNFTGSLVQYAVRIDNHLFGNSLPLGF